MVSNFDKTWSFSNLKLNESAQLSKLLHSTCSLISIEFFSCIFDVQSIIKINQNRRHKVQVFKMKFCSFTKNALIKLMKALKIIGNSSDFTFEMLNWDLIKEDPSPAYEILLKKLSIIPGRRHTNKICINSCSYKISSLNGVVETLE